MIEGVCEEYRVPYFACRGYASQSELFAAGKRFAAQWNQHGKKSAMILHLGDHDPSGLDMTRDIMERIDMMVGFRWVDVRRLALNMDQIEQYDPPPNPAKDTDARFAGYQDEFGDSSWELDALDPDVISDLIRNELDDTVQLEQWNRAMTREEKNQRSLRKVSARWGEIVDFVNEEPEE